MSVESTLIDILRRVQSLESNIQVQQSQDVLEIDPTWTGVTYEGSWADYDGSHTVGYFKTGGKVYLRGWMKDGTINTSAFTLPAGYCPAQALRFPVYSYNATDSGGDTIHIGICKVETSGEVIPSVGSNTLISVDNVTYYADS